MTCTTGGHLAFSVTKKNTQILQVNMGSAVNDPTISTSMLGITFPDWRLTMHYKSIEIIRHPEDSRVTTPEHTVEIRCEGKPVTGVVSSGGYVYLLVDCSGSMSVENKLSQAKKGSLSFARDAVAKGYRVGLIQFSISATRLCEPTREVAVLDRCLGQIELGSETHMAKGIYLAHEQLAGMAGARAIVVVTDGIPNGPGDPQASLQAGKEAKRDGIDILTIGTDDANAAFLKKLASRADLGMKVTRERFEQAIASSAKLLPSSTQTRIGEKAGQ